VSQIAMRKKGGKQVGEGSTKCFRNFVASTGAIDLGFSGHQYTWSNKRVGLANIKEWLDRGLCNADWQCMFPKAGVKHLTFPTSDHSPILLDTHIEKDYGARPFRFEAMWIKDSSSLEVVDDTWQCNIEGSHNFRLAKKLKRVKWALKKWNKECFGYAKTRIKELEKRIADLQDLESSPSNLEQEAALSLELNDWLEREELKWRQKSRELWLKE
jgi:hypothetical protein